MDSFVVFSYVKETRVSNYDNGATIGADKIARDLINELKPIFRTNIADLGPRSTRSDILEKLEFAAQRLNPNGICFFYFHGHGDSLKGRGIDDESNDEVLVCHDDFLYDDEIEQALTQFRPSHRFFSIIDSCSSETAIEWSTLREEVCPNIIHLASARDGDEAGALPQGGLFSRRIFNLIYGGAYSNYSYQSFCTRMQLASITLPCYIKMSSNVSSVFLNTKLFK